MKQDKIWDHFQSEGTEIFLQSIPRLNYIFRQAATISKKPLTVLNIGVGDAWLERKCIQEGWTIHSLDPSEKTIEKLLAEGINGKVGYIEDIPYEDNSFDVVFCSEVLEHLSNHQIDLGLKEIHRILKPGGKLIGTVPFNENLEVSKVVCPDCGKIFHRWGHQQSFNLQNFPVIFPNSMKIIELKVIYVVNWNFLNWKGLILAAIKKTLLQLGIHGGNENLFFIVEKYDYQ